MAKKLLFTFFLFLITFAGAQDFVSKWDTNLPGSSGTNEVTIPTNAAFTYDYTVDWGDGNIDNNVTGDITHTYATAGVYDISISGTFPAIYFNDGGDRRKIIEILSWGTIAWQSMENAFHGCENLNFDAIDSPDLSQVTTLENMFKDCTTFNGIVNNWDISNVTNLAGLFDGAVIFNRPLDNWNTNAVTNMARTFRQARLFNEPLDNWNTQLVTTLEQTFLGASRFNQNINNWDVSLVTNMEYTFGSTIFNQALNNWNVTNVTTMKGMFYSSDFDLPIQNWNVSNVTNMSSMFASSEFNQPINNWSVSNVTDMSLMFQRAKNFNQPLDNWDVSNVTTMASMFDGYYWTMSFNQPLNSWDVSSVTEMQYMFRDNNSFNQPLNNWDVSNVTNMQGMFNDAVSFDQDISMWNVGIVNNMSEMFFGAAVFNQNLNVWNVSSVTNISRIFQAAANFDQPLNNWDVSNVTNMSRAFQNAPLFNRPLDNWVTSAVTNMTGMFLDAVAYDQNLASWNISNVTDMTDMLADSGLSQANYDSTLIGWGAQTVQADVDLGSTNLYYCDGRDARQDLIDNYNWNITGDIINCSFVLCTQLTSPTNGDTNVPANADIFWEAVPGATGYYVTIRVFDGTNSTFIMNNQDVGNVVGIEITNDFTPGDEVFVTIVPYNGSGPATGCSEESFTIVPRWYDSPDAFIWRFDTNLTDYKSTPSNQLKIEINNSFTYDFSIDWGDGQFDNNVTGAITHTYLTPGEYTVAIIGTFPAPHFYYSNTDNYKLISIDQWGTQQWQSLEMGFYYAANMEYNAADVPDLSQATNMRSTFSGCSLFNGNINNWDVSNITDLSSTFIGCTAYNQPLNNWNVSNVTNMSATFLAATAFDQNINNWDTSSVTTMADMFRQATAFNQPLDNWNVSNVTNMEEMFERATSFNQPLNSWDVSNVTNMTEMFNGFVNDMIFNQPLNNWDVSSVTEMDQMFYRCVDFNQPLNNWDVSSVTTMEAMFLSARSFNQPLNNWNVTNVTQMRSMFSSAEAFNGDITTWNVTNVLNMQSMFQSALAFNQPIGSWDVNSVVNMSHMFRLAQSFNQPLNTWNVSAVATMESMFEDAVAFNQPLNSWDVSSVTIMNSMFEDAALFNQDINSWDVASVTNFEAMFKNALAFNSPLGNWDTGEGLTMFEMFMGASMFDQNIDSWNVGFVSTMASMFEGALAFNQNLDSWNVASVTTMEAMFKNATSFNGVIDSWNVRKVSAMSEMFMDASNFDQSVNSWRVSGISDMTRMFQNAISLNQTFDQWNVGTVNMSAMFSGATSLDQTFENWNVEQVTNMVNMLDNTSLSRENYDNTLIAWSAQNLTPGLTLGAQGLLYCDAVEERQSMIDNFGWNITGDMLDCPVPECTTLIAPANGEIDVPVNTNLTWEPVLFAKGYYLTVRVDPGNVTIVNNLDVTETSYEFASDFAGGETVYVSLIPYNDTGDAAGCSEESFIITSTNTPTVPECTNLMAPLNGDVDVAVNTSLEWTAISNADGYRISLGSTPMGTDILNNFDAGNTTTYDHGVDYPEDTIIYVTITPYNSVGDATACTEESFTTELTTIPPPCTYLTSPVNGSTDVYLDTNLTWNPVPEATGYLVIVGTTSGGIEVVNNEDVGNVTYYNFSADLSTNRMHYVTIIPYNDDGDAVGCAEESFRTGTSTSNSPPDCTTLSAPLNGATNVDVITDLSWNVSPLADGYYLSVGTSAGGIDILNNQDVGNVTTYDLVSDLPESTTIYVTVLPYNGYGNASGCVEESFTTAALPTVPNCTSLTMPMNNATDVSISTDLSWNSEPSATGYRLTVGTSSGATDILNNLDVGNVTTYNLVSDLPENTTIYLTITPYNGVGSAAGCSEENFTTGAAPTAPVCTTLTIPSNGATNVDATTNLSWSPITNADGYRLTVGTTTGGNDILDNLDVGNVTSYDLASDLPFDTTIFVTITPYNAVGSATACSEESFTTAAGPTVPSCTQLVSPLNGSTDVVVTTDLSWNSVSNADGYRLTVGTTTGGNDILDNLDVGNVTTFDLASDLPFDTTIFVTITPYNAVGSATACSEESFTTASGPTVPSCTQLVSPLNGSTDVVVTTDLSWNSVPNADGYRLTVGTSTGANDLVDNVDVGNTNAFELAQSLPSNTTIFIQITPYNAQGDAVSCTEESFTTEDAPVMVGCTELTTPAQGDIDVPLDVLLEWTMVDFADGYRISVGTTPGGSEIIDNEDVGILTSYQLAQPLPEGSQIFVRVTAYNANGDATGCNEVSFNTILEEEELIESLYGFSPQGDGMNDFWRIEGIENFPDNTVMIYNRWGDLVFKTSGYDNASNVFRGDANQMTQMGAGQLPEGTYFFQLILPEGHNLKQTQGYLVIKR